MANVGGRSDDTRKAVSAKERGTDRAERLGETSRRQTSVPRTIPLPQESGEHKSLSSVRGTSTGLLVDTNLEISIPDTYRAPPPPLPYDADSPAIVGADVRFGGSDISGAFEKTGCKVKTDSTVDSKLSEDQPSKLKSETVTSATDKEDFCPTCFEDYDLEILGS